MCHWSSTPPSLAACVTCEDDMGKVRSVGHLPKGKGGSGENQQWSMEVRAGPIVANKDMQRQSQRRKPSRTLQSMRSRPQSGKLYADASA
ncbi:hypothetical protein B296_00011190 [Ensete ventricosum]|uniref:Uncharacterized protein n=1 Tax=Ensete ventricosum TaxID=4639 RepID=A0A427AXQ4_ENSVE|nr:hypothetical protein B296_00011190 [Ensete ventricosum]